LYSAGIEGTKTEATVEGKNYKVVWSCLLLVEMIMSNVACAAHFQTLAANVVGKTSELLRLFNSRATQLVLGAGAIHSVAQLKSINAKHLALVTQCVNMVLALLPHVRAALMAQLPGKQHTLLADLDKIKKEYIDHHDKVLSKFVSIIGGVVEHNLATRIPRTAFDERSKIPRTKDLKELSCCPFLAGVVTNTRKLHQVLIAFLPSEDLMDAFSRIFAHLDTKIPNLFITANGKERVLFSFPTSVDGKRRMILEMKATSLALNDLPNVRPWDFTAMKFLERTLEVALDEEVSNEVNTPLAKETNEDTESGKNESNEIQENGNTHLDTGNSSEEPKEIYVDMVEQEQRNEKNLNDMDKTTAVKENPLTNEEPNGIQAQNSSASMDDLGNNNETQINADGIKAIQFGSNEISSKVEGSSEAMEEVCSETLPNPLDEDAGIQAFVSGDLGKSDKEYDGPSETESDTLASSACASNEDQRDDEVGIGNLQ
jgi:vacuolar protein sorting-associated protein 54